MYTMQSPQTLPTRHLLGLALISACVIALEVTLTRIFSITIWYHFAYLVVGMALLGGGAAGTFLAVRRWPVATLSQRLSKITVLFSLCVLLSLVVITFVRFDPLSLNLADLATSLVGLAAYFIAVFAMFFSGGLVVTSVFRLHTAHSHRLYFADLLGASAATLAVLAVISVMGGPGALMLIAVLALAAAALFADGLPALWKAAMTLLGLVQVGILILTTFISPIQLPVPQSKELGDIMQQLGVRQPEYTRWNPVARVDVLPPTPFGKDNSWVIFGGLSSKYYEQPSQVSYPMHFVTLDGTSTTAMHEFTGDLSRFNFLEYAIVSAPYHIGVTKPSVLTIGSGGGLDILLARKYEAKQITAIDLNADLVALLKGKYADFTGRLAEHPTTHIEAAEGRSFLMRDTGQYDLIQGIGLDNFAALSGGAYVLAESYLYTVDFVDLALDRLNPNGVLAWTRNLNKPPREMLRLMGMAAESLRKRGITDPARHVVIIASENEAVGTMLVSKAPFTESALAPLRAWAASNGYTLQHDPLATGSSVYSQYLISQDPRAFENNYPFNIYPATDDSPFFYNYFKWTNLFVRGASVGDVNTRLPIGNIILLIMLVFSALTAAAFIVWPLSRSRRNRLQLAGARPMLVYFSALGAGYMFVQIILIQRFTLFIGYPTQAITTTIFSMLIFSALGSLLAPKIIRTPAQLRLAVIGVAVAIGIYILALPLVLPPFLRLPDTARVLLSVLFIAPLALLMGMPFPTGLQQIGQQSQEAVPWAWGMNGVFSVIGSTLVVLVSQLSSFTVAMGVGLVLYLVAAVASPSLWPAHPSHDPNPIA